MLTAKDISIRLIQLQHCLLPCTFPGLQIVTLSLKQERIVCKQEDKSLSIRFQAYDTSHQFFPRILTSTNLIPAACMTFYTLETKLYGLSSLCHGSPQLKHSLALCLLSSRSQQRTFAKTGWRSCENYFKVNRRRFIV